MKSVYIKFGGGSRSWKRPSKWLNFPTTPSSEKVVKILLATFEGQPNWFTFMATAIGGVTWEIYDGVNPTPFQSGSTITISSIVDNITIDYDDCDASTFFRNYRQCYILIKPNNQANDFQIGFSIVHSIYGSGKIGQMLDVEINNIYIGIEVSHAFGAGVFYPAMLEQVKYKGSVTLTSSNNASFWGWLNYTTALENLEFENPLTIQGASVTIREAFRDSKLRHLPDNLIIGVCDNFYLTFYNSNLEIINVEYTNGTALGNDFGVCKATEINTSGTYNGSMGNFTSYTIKKLTLNGYQRGHSLVGNSMFGEDAFTAWVDSLGNASGSQTITVTLLQFNSFGGVGSYVATELTNKGYTLVY